MKDQLRKSQCFQHVEHNSAPGGHGTKKWLGQEGAMPSSIRQLETW